MKPTDDPFEEGFRARFADFGAEPNSLAFDRIRAELTAPSPRPARRLGGVVAVGTLLLLVSTRLGGDFAENRPAGHRGDPVAPAAVSGGRAADKMALNPPRGARRHAVGGTPTRRVWLPAAASATAGMNPSFRNDFTSQPTGNPPETSENQAISSELGHRFFSLNALSTHVPVFAGPRWVFPVVLGPPAVANQLVRARRLAWFGSVSGQYAYADLTTRGTDQTVVHEVQPVPRFAAARLGWRAQVGAEWTLSKTWSLRGALTFSQLRQSFGYLERGLSPDSVAARVDANGAVLQSFYRTTPERAVFQQQMAGLHLSVLRALGRTVYLHAGGETGLAWGTHPRQWTAALTAGLGFNRPLSSGWTLRVEPTLRYSLQTFQPADQRFAWRPYTVGLAVGLRK
jgi:hypothetical protein